MDLLNQIPNIDLGQGATKISEVSVGGKKDNCQLGQLQVLRFEQGRVSRSFFLDLQL